MTKNGFYGAVKTDDGIRAIYIDEGSLRAQQRREALTKRRRAEKAARRKDAAAKDKAQRFTMRVVKQELKLMGMGAVLCWGYGAGLVDPAFALPVLMAFQAVICFRAGRWYARQEHTQK